MNYDISELLLLNVRGMHILSAILWLGLSNSVSWFENTTAIDADTNENRAEATWVALGDSFYLVEKQNIPRSTLPLHILRWEGTIA
jgi:uncharacterized membrane protein